MTEGLQCNKDLLGTTATKWSPTVAAATATCSSRFWFFRSKSHPKELYTLLCTYSFLMLVRESRLFYRDAVATLEKNRKPSVQLCQHVCGKSFGILEGQERVQAAP